MRHLIPGVLLFTMAGMVFNACQNDPKNAQADIPKPIDTIRVKPVSREGAAVYEITKGTVNWTGKKAVGGTHEGIILVESGTLNVNQGQLIDGQLTLNMHSIAVTDIKDAGERRDLESHLKDSDFFEVEKHPTATLKFKEVLPSNTPNFNAVLVATLTMKGKTNPINIPVQLNFEGEKMTAVSPTFSINRTQWGVNFRSSLLNTAKDKLIEDNVLLSVTLEAKKDTQ